MIRTREQILQDIESNIALKAKFESFHEDRKKEFLDFCTGERGVKILYDSFFNAVMNPDIYPERIRHLIGSILGKDIVSFRVMQRSSFSIGDDRSLVIMDIVVELAGGEIINLEVQKIGYDFPGERAACYASDLAIRQYARARNEASQDPDKTFRTVEFRDNERKTYEKYYFYHNQIAGVILIGEIIQRILYGLSRASGGDPQTQRSP